MTQLDDLVIQATMTPVASPPEMDELHVLARRRSRRRATSTVAAVVLAVLTVGIVIASNSSRSSTRSLVATPGPTHAAPVDLDLEAALTPVSSADLAQSYVLLNFYSKVGTAAVNKCLSERGSPGRAEDNYPFTINQNTRYFEDPAQLRATGIVPIGAPGPAEPDPGSTGDSEPKASSADLGACATEAREAIKPLTDLLALFYQWNSEVQRLQTSPAMASAWQSWQECMASTGYPAESEIAFLGMVDTAVRERRLEGDFDGARDVMMTMSRAYADCIEANVITTRDKVRVDARPSFLEAHADEWSWARAHVDTVITGMSERYSVPLD